MTEAQIVDVSKRMDPPLKEYFDQYVVIAVPVDDPLTGIHFGSLSGSSVDREMMENHVIALAQSFLAARRIGQGN